MATTILLWDMRFPAASPRRLTVDDRIAGYAVRSGWAAAADPAQAGSLASGAAVSGASPTLTFLQHGRAAQQVSPVWLPLEVAQYAASLGLAGGVSGSIGPAPGFAISSTALPTARVGAAFVHGLGTTGGSPPVTFVLSAGSLPPGLANNFTGTPTGL